MDNKVHAIRLDAADGSAIQIAFLTYRNQMAQVEKASLEVQIQEAAVREAKDNLKAQHGILNQTRGHLTTLLAQHKIPDGWNWVRAEDGSYKFTAPAPAGPGPMIKP